MNFTAKDVAELRAMTSAGMMDCKNALVESNGDMEAAINYLRQKGIAKAAKKAGNIAAEGVIATAADAKTAVLVEVNAQTDFVVKNEDFQAFVAKVAQAALTNKTKDIDSLLKADLNGQSVADTAVELTAKIGEKIEVRRVALVEASGGVASYVHPVGSKIGVLVALSKADASKGSDIAMHIAASNPAPEFIDRTEIPAETIAKEKELESQKDDLKGKPAEIIEKIVTGRVDKLLAERVLLEQPFVKDPSTKVLAFLGDITVESFVRFNLGDGVEKKTEDYAAEVAAAMKV
ncbi:MAG: translation elongation factor Ts [Cyanobacteria bacterium]|nr:translation elongation factor Ts [Cyanobacteriota bacterium]